MTQQTLSRSIWFISGPHYFDTDVHTHTHVAECEQQIHIWESKPSLSPLPQTSVSLKCAETKSHRLQWEWQVSSPFIAFHSCIYLLINTTALVQISKAFLRAVNFWNQKKKTQLKKDSGLKGASCSLSAYTCIIRMRQEGLNSLRCRELGSPKV